jgi:hypothetical protein
MDKKQQLNFDDIVKKSKQTQTDKDTVITLKEYLGIVRNEPGIANSSPARIWEMFEQRAGKKSQIWTKRFFRPITGIT